VIRRSSRFNPHNTKARGRCARISSGLQRDPPNSVHFDRGIKCQPYRYIRNAANRSTRRAAQLIAGADKRLLSWLGGIAASRFEAPCVTAPRRTSCRLPLSDTSVRRTRVSRCVVHRRVAGSNSPFAGCVS